MDEELGDKKVKVVRSPGSYERAVVLLENLMDIKWDNITGGYNKKCNRYYLTAKIYPSDIIEGSISCSGRHDYERFGVKIIILKKYNEEIYEELKKLAKNKPPEQIKHKVSSKKLIIEILEKRKTITRKELRDIVLKDNFKPTTFLKSFKDLIKEEIIETEGSNNSCNQIIKLKNT